MGSVDQQHLHHQQLFINADSQALPSTSALWLEKNPEHAQDTWLPRVKTTLPSLRCSLRGRLTNGFEFRPMHSEQRSQEQLVGYPERMRGALLSPIQPIQWLNEAQSAWVSFLSRPRRTQGKRRFCELWRNVTCFTW